MNQLIALNPFTPNSLTYIFIILPSVSRTFHHKWLSRASHKILQTIKTRVYGLSVNHQNTTATTDVDTLAYK